MDKTLKTLSDGLKKVLNHLQPEGSAFSFIILTGKLGHGKTALLYQSELTHFPMDLDLDKEKSVNFFYNKTGIILELGESWLNQSESLIGCTLKQLNRCHKSIKVTGIIICVDAHELLMAEPLSLSLICKAQAQLLGSFCQGLGYHVNVALFLTKLDLLAGFCEFFQSEVASESHVPLGFSLQYKIAKDKSISNYRQQFDKMIEVISQKTINKLHPARSNVKRMLIRELPLQLLMLRGPIYTLLQHLTSSFMRVNNIYFTSAEQGGLSIDSLNKRIQLEYALLVQDKFPQSSNYCAYFIAAALKTFQAQTARDITQVNLKQQRVLFALVITMGVGLLCFVQQYFRTTNSLDTVNKELLTYKSLSNGMEDKTAALYHLSLASNKLAQTPGNFFSVTSLGVLKTQLDRHTKNVLQNNFAPHLLSDLEDVLLDPSQTQLARYLALKIYLLLGGAKHYSESVIERWYIQHWSEQKNISKSDISKKLFLLKQTLKQPFQPLAINQQLVSDVRNYLNAIPVSYLYYLLAKSNFPTEKQIITVKGFELPVKDLPIYFTKKGFKQQIINLPHIAALLQKENWILERQDLKDLPAILVDAYCLDYVSWWQHLMQGIRPIHYQSYDEGHKLIATLDSNNSILKLIAVIQQETSPENTQQDSKFNQVIANQFASLNLLSHSSIDALIENINELAQFLTTVSLVHDKGETVFKLTKARFQGVTLSDPLSNLYNKANQLPDPIAAWAKQLADDTWFIFINESRKYLDKKWKEIVYFEYKKNIADRYPFISSDKDEITIVDFDKFFAPRGILNVFINDYIKPFLDTSIPQWREKEVNGYKLPISSDILNELIRANIISNMFFQNTSTNSKIEFSLQKISLDPVVSELKLSIGKTTLKDSQNSESLTLFNWPESDATLSLSSIEGHHYDMEEKGPWAFFKILQKVNVLVDSSDSASLQILFEVNGNSGRYLLKTENQINPFSPGILTGFSLKESL